MVRATVTGTLSYSVEIDRQSNIFDLNIDYNIDGYTDPETGEYFGDTTWNLSFARVPGGGIGGQSDFASESASITAGLVQDFAPGLFLRGLQHFQRRPQPAAGKLGRVQRRLRHRPADHRRDRNNRYHHRRCGR